MKPSSIAIIGVGYVGSTIAYTLGLLTSVSEILLVDCDTAKCTGELLDLQDAFAHYKTTVRIASYKEAASADIIVISAGKNQKQNQARSELLHANITVIDSIIKELGPINQQAVLIVVTNPIDTLTWYIQQKNILPHNHIFGSGTWLDTKRVYNFLQHKITLPSNALPYVLGEHGDSQYIVWPKITPFSTLTAAEKTIIAENVKQEVYTIIQLKGYTSYGIARCVAEYCSSILLNKNDTFPLSVFNNKNALTYGQLATLGASGVTEILDVPHSTHEAAEREKSLESLRLQRANINN